MNRKAKYFWGWLILLGAGNCVVAQEVIYPLAGNPVAKYYYASQARVRKSVLADTLELPFFDDFSNRETEPDPARWSDRDAFINNSYAIDPVSNGVATLDALDFEGSIYHDATLYPTTFVADRLTSLPVNLAYPAGDSIYLSFLYQPGGLGEPPEVGDSLMVDFYSMPDTAWINVWSVAGTSDTLAFAHVMIPVTGERYLNGGFRFRFRNRASLPRNNDYPDMRGNVDHWHVDYVRLDRNRFSADTILRDVAFSTSITPVLKDLTSIPWAHFEDAYNTVLDPTLSVRYRNNDTIPRNITRTLVIEEPMYSETYSPGTPTAQDIPSMQDTVVEFSYIYPFDFDRGNTALIRFKASIRTDDFDPKVNDTVVNDQVFRDYYAYDDGTAEAGYGLRGQGSANGSVAMKYKAYMEDQIGGVDISFNQLFDSLNTGYYFRLVVWDDNDGVPGQVSYEDDQDFTVLYPSSHPGFVRYRFSQPVTVNGTFYVGWRQYNEYMLNVGFDMNSRPSSPVLFYNLGGSWEKSGFPGVIMLRPFLYDEATGAKVPEAHPEGIPGSLHLYPNPASDWIRVTIPDQGQDEYPLEFYDISGRLVGQESIGNGQLDVSRYAAGIYYLRLRAGYRYYHAKLLINR